MDFEIDWTSFNLGLVLGIVIGFIIGLIIMMFIIEYVIFGDDRKQRKIDKHIRKYHKQMRVNNDQK